jgi:hypothetical protein
MSAEQIATLGYDVYANHKNEELLFNATNHNTESLRSILNYLYDVNFYWMAFQILFTICLYLMARWVDQLQKRIETLEENRPEKHPLLASF